VSPLCGLHVPGNYYTEPHRSGMSSPRGWTAQHVSKPPGVANAEDRNSSRPYSTSPKRIVGAVDELVVPCQGARLRRMASEERGTFMF
jgi:hypothetical protein